MKILWVSHLVPYPPKAGVLLRCFNLLKELSTHHDVHLLAFNQRNLIEPYFNSFEEGTEIAREALSSMCKEIHFFNCPTDKRSFSKLFCAAISLVSRAPYSVNWLKSAEFSKQIHRMHKENKYDLIHFDTISLAPYIKDLSKLDAPYLTLDHHNIESHMLIRRSQLEKNIIKRIYFLQEGIRLKRVEKKYCPMFDSNITCSELDIDRLKTFVKSSKFKCIPNGVDINYFKPSGVEPKPFRLIFIGTLDWYPNIRAVRFIAYELWPILKERIPEIEIDIVGSKPPLDIVKAGKSLDGFKVHGFVDNIFPLLSDATAYICPINDGGGTKLKLLDAFAAGKAVIADPIACEGLNTQDGKQLLLATTAHEFVDKIASVIEDIGLRRELEQNARAHAVEFFSFKSIGHELANHYSELAGIHTEFSDQESQ